MGTEERSAAMCGHEALSIIGIWFALGVGIGVVAGVALNHLAAGAIAGSTVGGIVGYVLSRYR
jgi:hypothetical protein